MKTVIRLLVYKLIFELFFITVGVVGVLGLYVLEELPSIDSAIALFFLVLSYCISIINFGRSMENVKNFINDLEKDVGLEDEKK